MASIEVSIFRRHRKIPRPATSIGPMARAPQADYLASMHVQAVGNSFDARVYGVRLHQELDQLVDDFREAAEVVQDPHFKALCATGAEVLVGLRTTLEHYAQGRESIWRDSGFSSVPVSGAEPRGETSRRSPEPLAREVAAATDY